MHSKFTKTAASGQHNVHRDLLRKIPKAVTKLTTCAVPLKVSSGKGSIGRVATLSLPFLLPEDIWNSILKAQSNSNHSGKLLEDIQLFVSTRLKKYEIMRKEQFL